MMDEEFVEFDDTERQVRITRNEALYLSDSTTLMIERDITEQISIGSMRNVAPSAPLPVPIELVDKIGMAVLYTTDSDNEGKDYLGTFLVNELYLLREIAQSYVKVGNEQVGFNLQKKIYKAILNERYVEDMRVDRLLEEASKEATLNKALTDFNPS